jgi:hypothetical protein
MMLGTTRSASHRDATAGHSPRPFADHGKVLSPRHRRPAISPDPGSTALLWRYAGTGAAWLVAFGLFAMAAGWMRTGALGLAAGVVIALVLVAAQLIRRGHTRAADVSRLPGGSRSSEWVRT